ncbi:MAG: SDR family oxidoreductase [Bradymonadia bacterium]
MYPSLDASKHVVFVTGATAGFGEATARRFAHAGARVIITGRRADRLEALQAELGERCWAHTLDVTDRDAVDAVAAALPQDFADVSVLVNNAGLALGLEPAWDVDMADWETMVSTNINGLLYCTRALLPAMVARRRGHVINMSSVAANWPYPGANVYGATKAFVTQFSLNLRADLHGTGVRVTDIEPGLAETEFSRVRFKGDDAKAEAPYANTRPLTAEDIAESVFWATCLPEHVNINRIEVMSTDQAFGPFPIHRQG